ncbi:MAG: SH3 domain-containing protein [Mesorhizobium sp.]|nr:MAG: SH3 domain-containing protein [Mesorhizobium sp.]
MSEMVELFDGSEEVPADPEHPTAPPTQPPELTEPPETPDPDETPAQLVVTAENGLNLMVRPSTGSAIVTVPQPGALVDETGERITDQAGNVWVPVSGYGADGRQYDGWVSGDFVAGHATGDQDENGRINPELDQLGYRWVKAQDGDSIRLIAVSHSADVAKTVMLNMNHILNPALIDLGDKIYLPN